MRSPSTRHVLPVVEKLHVLVDHAIIYTTVAIYFPSTAEQYLHLRSVTTRYNLVQFDLVTQQETINVNILL